MATSNQQIDTPAVPDLPTPETTYNSTFVTKTNAVLRIYFTRITTALAVLFGPRGGKYLNIPYGAFSDTTDQTATANTATVMTFNTTDFSNGVTVESNSKLTVAQAGIYNLQFSAQFDNADTQEHDVSIWLRKDASGAGVDITGSAGLVGVPSKHGAFNGHLIVGWNYYITLNANEFVEIWWSTPSTQVTIQAYAAGTSPTRPSTASVVATLTFVSNISA